MLVPLLHMLAIARLSAIGNGGGVAEIHVYNRVGAPVQTLRHAVAHAQGVFDKSGVRTVWKLCPTPGEVPKEQACDSSNGAFSLGVVRENKELFAHRDTFTIGYTLRTAGRNNAAVIWPRIQNFALFLGINSDLLLGFAMAHEVGHLLSPVGHHSTGVMDPAWDRGDAIDMARGRLGFCDRDVEQMRLEMERKKGRSGSYPQIKREGSAMLPR